MTITCTFVTGSSFFLFGYMKKRTVEKVDKRPVKTPRVPYQINQRVDTRKDFKHLEFVDQKELSDTLTGILDSFKNDVQLTVDFKECFDRVCEKAKKYDDTQVDSEKSLFSYTQNKLRVSAHKYAYFTLINWTGDKYASLYKDSPHVVKFTNAVQKLYDPGYLLEAVCSSITTDHYDMDNNSGIVWREEDFVEMVTVCMLRATPATEQGCQLIDQWIELLNDSVLEDDGAVEYPGLYIDEAWEEIQKSIHMIMFKTLDP